MDQQRKRERGNYSIISGHRETPLYHPLFNVCFMLWFVATLCSLSLSLWFRIRVTQTHARAQNRNEKRARGPKTHTHTTRGTSSVFIRRGARAHTKKTGAILTATESVEHGGPPHNYSTNHTRRRPQQEEGGKRRWALGNGAVLCGVLLVLRVVQNDINDERNEPSSVECCTSTKQQATRKAAHSSSAESQSHTVTLPV